MLTRLRAYETPLRANNRIVSNPTHQPQIDVSLRLSYAEVLRAIRWDDYDGEPVPAQRKPCHRICGRCVLDSRDRTNR